MDTTLVLPWPPSVNSYYRSVNRGRLAGRVLISEKGRAYRAAVEEIVQKRDMTPITGRLTVYIVANPPDRRRRDLDNLLKATLDSIVHGGAIPDDSLIDHLTIVRGPVTNGGSISVNIKNDKDL
jgi:crossover junction endodeoxyribonuclease RusA